MLQSDAEKGAIFELPNWDVKAGRSHWATHFSRIFSVSTGFPVSHAWQGSTLGIRRLGALGVGH